MHPFELDLQLLDLGFLGLLMAFAKQKGNGAKTEQRWRTTNLDVDFQRFKRAKSRATYLMNRARSEFYSNLELW